MMRQILAMEEDEIRGEEEIDDAHENIEYFRIGDFFGFEKDYGRIAIHRIAYQVI